MIITQIKQLALKNGIKTAYQLQKAATLSPSMAARLYRDDVEMISLKTLDSLCTTLNCSPNELFGYSATLSSNNAVSNSVKDNTQPANDSSDDVLTDRDSSETKATTTTAFDDLSENLLTLAQVGARLGVSRKSVNDYIIKGKLAARKIKRQNFVRESDLIEFQTTKKGK